MKVIITGTSGFVGQNLSKYLQDKGIEVECLSVRGADWKRKLKKGADVIIHLAGKAHDTKNTSSVNEYFTVNRDLTIELFDEYIKSDIEQFFFFSSVKAAADSVVGLVTEEVVPNPVTPYGKSKIEAETYILNKHIPKGKKVYVIRPCMIHGPGNKGNLNLLFKIVAKRIPWPLGAFENKRSFLSIDNMNFLIDQMLTKSDLNSGIYNFSDDDSISTNELIEYINQALGKKTIFLPISKKMMITVAGLGDKLHLPLNSERLKKLTESYVVSNQKIKSALGIDRLPFSAKEGIIKTINSFK